jgi:hypothetical protein
MLDYRMIGLQRQRCPRLVMMIGKTGSFKTGKGCTANNPRLLNDDAWFVGMAPHDDIDTDEMR